MFCMQEYTDLQGTMMDSFLQKHVDASKMPEGVIWQKPKLAPFCMNGAASHTSLHQIRTNLASS